MDSPLLLNYNLKVLPQKCGMQHSRPKDVNQNFWTNKFRKENFHPMYLTKKSWLHIFTQNLGLEEVSWVQKFPKRFIYLACASIYALWVCFFSPEEALKLPLPINKSVNGLLWEWEYTHNLKSDKYFHSASQKYCTMKSEKYFHSAWQKYFMMFAPPLNWSLTHLPFKHICEIMQNGSKGNLFVSICQKLILFNNGSKCGVEYAE